MIRAAAMRAGLRELVPWIALAALWAVFVCVRHGGLYLASDDAYIYLGYVKRALTPPRELFSYNPGEHSAGVTGMLYYYTLLAVCGLVRALSFSSSLEADLLLGTFLANSALLLFAAHLYLRCWRRLTDGAERISALALSIAFLLFCAQPKWLWAVFVGLEGPLAACLTLLLLERLLQRAPAWHVAAAAALLVATRPETMLAAWLPPAFAVLAERRSPSGNRVERPLLHRLGAAYAVGGACLAAVVLPCYELTGRVFPSSLGTRVHLAALLEPEGLTRYFGALFASRDYWLSECIVAFLALRAVAGLAPFSVEDRYVSYLWPLYALGVAACASAALRATARVRLEPSRATLALASLAVYAVAAALPVRDFLDRSSWHVATMNAIVVEPSRWMRAQLPPDARVCMEPAGALRVFTDFYLVDVIGLTTPHATTHSGNYLDFLHDHRVGWVFDRPDHTGTLLLARRAGRDVRAFARGMPWGDVHLYEVDLSATIPIVRLSAQPQIQGRPRAVFDNNTLASWNQLTGGGSRFSRSQPPERISAEFERSAVVDGLSLALSGTGAPLRRASDAYAFEGKRGVEWTRLRTGPARSESAGPNQAIVTFSLSEAVPLDGIRVVRERSTGGPTPVVDELTLGRGGRPYVWLWSVRVSSGG